MRYPGRPPCGHLTLANIEVGVLQEDMVERFKQALTRQQQQHQPWGKHEVAPLGEGNGPGEKC